MVDYFFQIFLYRDTLKLYAYALNILKLFFFCKSHYYILTKITAFGKLIIFYDKKLYTRPHYRYIPQTVILKFFKCIKR